MTTFGELGFSRAAEALLYGEKLGGVDERFVALYVDDDVELFSDAFVGFAYAVGAAAMVDARHDGLSSECFDGISDAFVVGCYDGFVQYTVHGAIDVLDDCASTQHGQRFGWKAR